MAVVVATLLNHLLGECTAHIIYYNRTKQVQRNYYFIIIRLGFFPISDSVVSYDKISAPISVLGEFL
jgi:hypothetical protein